MHLKCSSSFHVLFFSPDEQEDDFPGRVNAIIFLNHNVAGGLFSQYELGF